mmetsp:Transcript_15293/g.33758  ORF Transcript_15293/g.33758 Transcript_15293/m.33758 type:complete len:550 (+) Transcript_15293:2270-3919(+)
MGDWRVFERDRGLIRGLMAEGVFFMGEGEASELVPPLLPGRGLECLDRPPSAAWRARKFFRISGSRSTTPSSLSSSGRLGGTDACSRGGNGADFPGDLSATVLSYMSMGGAAPSARYSCNAKLASRMSRLQFFMALLEDTAGAAVRSSKSSQLSLLLRGRGSLGEECLGELWGRRGWGRRRTAATGLSHLVDGEGIPVSLSSVGERAWFHISSSTPASSSPLSMVPLPFWSHACRGDTTLVPRSKLSTEGADAEATRSGAGATEGADAEATRSGAGATASEWNGASALVRALCSPNLLAFCVWISLYTFFANSCAFFMRVASACASSRAPCTPSSLSCSSSSASVRVLSHMSTICSVVHATMFWSRCPLSPSPSAMVSSELSLPCRACRACASDLSLATSSRISAGFMAKGRAVLPVPYSECDPTDASESVPVSPPSESCLVTVAGLKCSSSSISDCRDALASSANTCLLKRPSCSLSLTGFMSLYTSCSRRSLRDHMDTAHWACSCCRYSLSRSCTHSPCSGGACTLPCRASCFASRPVFSSASVVFR